MKSVSFRPSKLVPDRKSMVANFCECDWSFRSLSISQTSTKDSESVMTSNAENHHLPPRYSKIPENSQTNHVILKHLAAVLKIAMIAMAWPGNRIAGELQQCGSCTEMPIAIACHHRCLQGVANELVRDLVDRDHRTCH